MIESAREGHRLAGAPKRRVGLAEVPEVPRSKVEGRDAPIYGWFTEGFDTRDLVDAKALLDELT